FEAGQHSISIDGLSNFDATRSVYLEDKETGAMIDMRSTNSYTFETQKGDFNNRLVLHFKNNNDTPTDIGEINNGGAIAYVQNNNTIMVECDWDFAEKTLELFNISGQLTTQKQFRTNKYEIDGDNLPAGIYILKLTSENKIYTQKLLIN
uniref:T9SS type A sorting domain-containing protein n=1 Tax=Carboxylicivirga fragile TaxID=3417571 RepID=UPI003D3381A6|nr:T9SS type A sorting domain-containing protein [Marinilabiliaceae bacterium N1Y90]